jgi:hypothetical protein
VSSAELRGRDDDQHNERRCRTNAVDEGVALPVLLTFLLVMAHHSGLRQSERREDAHCVERDQRIRESVERDEEQRRGAGQKQDAVREHEPVASVGHLPWEIAVPGNDRRQAREVRIRGVRREREDQRGRDLEYEEHGSVAEHQQTHLGEDGLVMARVRLELLREHGDAEEEHAEDGRHPHEGRRRVLGLGSPKRGDSVRDRFHSGERDRTRRKPLQDQEDPERARAVCGALERFLVERHGPDVVEQEHPRQAVTHERGDHDDVEVRRRREQPA